MSFNQKRRNSGSRIRFWQSSLVMVLILSVEAQAILNYDMHQKISKLYEKVIPCYAYICLPTNKLILFIHSEFKKNAHNFDHKVN